MLTKITRCPDISEQACALSLCAKKKKKKKKKCASEISPEMFGWETQSDILENRPSNNGTENTWTLVCCPSPPFGRSFFVVCSSSHWLKVWVDTKVWQNIREFCVVNSCLMKGKFSLSSCWHISPRVFSPGQLWHTPQWWRKKEKFLAFTTTWFACLWASRMKMISSPI